MAVYNQAKANKAYYLSRDLCPYCGGKRQIEPGKKRCTVCLFKDAEQHRRKREQKGMMDAWRT